MKAAQKGCLGLCCFNIECTCALKQYTWSKFSTTDCSVQMCHYGPNTSSFKCITKSAHQNISCKCASSLEFLFFIITQAGEEIKVYYAF